MDQDDPKTIPTPDQESTGTGPQPPESGNPLADPVRQLGAATGELSRVVGKLNEDSGRQFVSLTHWARTNRRMIWTLAVSVLLDIALSVGLGFALAVYHENSERISTLTQRLDTAQTIQRRNALCPLYDLFLAAENPKARAAYPQGPAAYDRAFAVIHQGYAALDCQAFITAPPPSPSPTH